MTMNKEMIIKVQEELEQMNLVDIAERMEEWSPEKRVLVSKLLAKRDLAQVFHLLSKDVRKELLEALTDPETALLVQKIESDDLVDTLKEMPANMVRDLLRYIDESKRSTINQLLKYPEESVGSLMSIDFISIRPGYTKDQMMDAVKHATGGHEHSNQLFLINEERQLIGFMYLSDLVKTKETDLPTIIKQNPIVVRTNDDQEKASDLFMKYQLLSLAVIDNENRLVGIITADDIFDVISDEIHEDYTLMSGIAKPEPRSYLETPVLKLVKDRIGWLLFLMLSATFTGYIIQRYEMVLASHVALAAYIPMLMDSGGNSGTQSSTLITRALATKKLEASDMLAVIRKEFSIGLIVGSVLAVTNVIRIMMTDQVSIEVALTVSITLIITVILSKIIGGVLPLFAESINQDPAVMAGPLITTMVDTFALFVYFQIATVLIS